METLMNESRNYSDQETNAQFVYSFGVENALQPEVSKSLLGGKGANLINMTKIGINVPPGAIITTECCLHYLKHNEIPDSLELQLASELKKIEYKLGLCFGDAEKPLLVSVRSGAPVSMPGMMDTILNLGLNDKTVEGLAKLSNNPRFAYDSYRRFIQMYSNVVLGIEHNVFEEVLEDLKLELDVINDQDLGTEDLKKLVSNYKELIRKTLKIEFPQDPYEQLWSAIKSVFNSWTNERAYIYRKYNNIPDNLGTAVNIQSMVFGNMGNNSATGVAFTRNPSNGENLIYGEYLINAQGEDVVAGIRTPNPIACIEADDVSMENVFPGLYNELCQIRAKLETHYKDMQDIEFTIQEGKLWILQTRSGKRTTQAAVKIAVDMVKEGLITKEDAILRIDPLSLDQLLHVSIDTTQKYTVITKGLPASPGAATGRVVFSSKDAEIKSKNYEVILVRNETSPEDIGGMYAARAIVTARGGMTSHAAVVARGIGKCCVTGAGNIKIDVAGKYFTVGDVVIKEDDLITVNGSTGEIILGEAKMVQPKLSEEFNILINWAKQIKHLKVRANADNPLDVQNALNFGAEGIGLCRTEHMFFEKDRINIMREMIISSNSEERKIALLKLLPFQMQDFKAIFKLMKDKPVTIRLLDPPLHEFLPVKDEEIKDLAVALDLTELNLRNKISALHEINPMLGNRGCRLAINYPEIYQMQVEAILKAALEVKLEENFAPDLEIMIPFIVSRKELDLVKSFLEERAQEIFAHFDDKIDYKIGTMIELPRAALCAADIAKTAEFFSFGTNDLTQTTYGISRDDLSSFLDSYKANNIFIEDPFVTLDEQAVGELIKIASERGKSTNANLKIGICGEHGGHPSAIKFAHDLGLDYVSCSPYRIVIAILSAAQSQLNS